MCVILVLTFNDGKVSNRHVVFNTAEFLSVISRILLCCFCNPQKLPCLNLQTSFEPIGEQSGLEFDANWMHQTDTRI